MLMEMTLLKTGNTRRQTRSDQQINLSSPVTDFAFLHLHHSAILHIDCVQLYPHQSIPTEPAASLDMPSATAYDALLPLLTPANRHRTSSEISDGLKRIRRLVLTEGIPEVVSYLTLGVSGDES